ncbi:serine threonine-protein kinase rio1 [Stylonychia lemnae]|uniref:Serine/threonine-protein kinase RIO1 n=1 Tax=Stylonychia lemnae TaxID=5949 RepID=A0A078BE35_STYLE|nr:serine threonine-protein kinase rio1 [Stylonychia lemnae]|eukprot:CDW91407.1 serine threonine-protein kinase rio1 [Stylonychia lemnae]
MNNIKNNRSAARNTPQIIDEDDYFDPNDFKNQQKTGSMSSKNFCDTSQKLSTTKEQEKIQKFQRREVGDSDPESQDESEDEYDIEEDFDGDETESKDEGILKAFYKQKMNMNATDKQHLLIQENKKINLNYVDHKLEMKLNTKVNNALKTQQAKIDDDRIRVKDKNDRATVDQVLDPRTLIVLHKMVKNQKLDQIYGCLSTGKEANVYLAEGHMDLDTMELKNPAEYKREFAIKIFKTSILVFKDRERYVEGEFRFRKGHCKSNPRKMVQLWAEKEVRNLKRLNQTNGLIKAPRPFLLKNNVIVMEFIGETGLGAPRLKDADIIDIQQTYTDVLFIMRRMYQMCRLVHADFSEYNMLYYNGEVYVIDVSQSVEHDHPMALDFLRRDCANVNDFFKKRGLQVLNTQQTFDFVTDFQIQDESQALADLFSKVKDIISAEDEVTDRVFSQSYIPRTLQELAPDEIEKQKHNDQKLYAKLTGLQIKQEEQLEGVIKEKPKDEQESSSDDDEEEENDESKSEDEDEVEEKKNSTVCLKGMTKEQMKEHKKKVKEEKREKRKTKIPKYVKKKGEQKNKHK